MESKVGDVVVVAAEKMQQAFLQQADGTPVFLCAISLPEYEVAWLREKFFELASGVAVERIRASGSDVRLVQPAPAPLTEANPHVDLPRWACISPIAEDVRDQLRSSAASDIRLSPSGLPVNCCRVSAVGAFGFAGQPMRARR
jgi:hypothetical protein